MAETPVTALDRRLSNVAELSPVGRHVAQFMRQNREFVLANSAVTIGIKTGTSDATIIRTLQQLGFSGLSDLKQVIVESLGSASSPAEDMRGTFADLKKGNESAIGRVIATHHDGFTVVQSDSCRSQIAAGVAALQDATRVVVFGIGPSSALANYVAYLLSRSGRRSRTLDVTGSMLADQLLDLKRGDGLLILAYGRVYKEVNAVFAEARKLRLSTVLVTEAPDTPLAKLADVAIAIPRGRPGQIALHGATLVGLEALVLALAAKDPDASLRSLDKLNKLRKQVESTRRSKS